MVHENDMPDIAGKNIDKTGHLYSVKCVSGCSSARLERLLWEQEVGGSNPLTPNCRIEMYYD